MTASSSESRSAGPAHRVPYERAYVCGLFAEMARTYGIVNLVASFGFARRWRRQCVATLAIGAGAHVLDLMTGMGELCPDVRRRVGASGRLLALDFCAAMCRCAATRGAAAARGAATLLRADALECPLEDACIDQVVCSFGLKTLSPVQLAALAREVHRVLRPGGSFSFVEISVPPSRILRAAFLAYLNHVVPVIGRVFMGNPDNYRMLGVYTQAFGSCADAVDVFTDAGLDVRLQRYFFGCATGLIGTKP